jgi:hypothetical protein
MTVRFADAEFPDGPWVADGLALREWTHDLSCELAEDAMLLAVGAERANAMIKARNAADAGRQAGDAPAGAVNR